MTAMAMTYEIAADAVRGNTHDWPTGKEIPKEIVAHRTDRDADRRWNERRGARAASPGIESFYSFGMEPRRAAIKSISPTGIFLLTEDRWLPGATVQLTLQNKSGGLDGHATQVRMAARVVRRELDGVGMEFLLGKTGTAKWLELFSRAVFLTEENDPVRVFRLARALAFLLRIAPPAESRIMDWISAQMSRERMASVVAIALHAESLLASQNLAPRIGISSHLVQSIIEEGSKAQDGQAQQFWSGFLASICAGNCENDESSLFLALLSRLQPVHIRILAAAGSRLTQSGWRTRPLGKSFGFSQEDLTRITGGRSRVEIDAAVGFLEALGLMEQMQRPSGDENCEQCDLAPSGLGLRFYARCSGQGGSSDACIALKLETAASA